MPKKGPSVASTPTFKFVRRNYNSITIVSTNKATEPRGTPHLKENCKTTTEMSLGNGRSQCTVGEIKGVDRW